MKQESEAYKYLMGKFPWLNETEVKMDIFVGPEIRELFTDHQFDNILMVTRRLDGKVLSVFIRSS
jgi:aromatic ring-cleaving dioxygenase